jgi:hypothetical protein
VGVCLGDREVHNQLVASVNIRLSHPKGLGRLTPRHYRVGSDEATRSYHT